MDDLDRNLDRIRAAVDARIALEIHQRQSAQRSNSAIYEAFEPTEPSKASVAPAEEMFAADNMAASTDHDVRPVLVEDPVSIADMPQTGMTEPLDISSEVTEPTLSIEESPVEQADARDSFERDISEGDDADLISSRSTDGTAAERVEAELLDGSGEPNAEPSELARLQAESIAAAEEPKHSTHLIGHGERPADPDADQTGREIVVVKATLWTRLKRLIGLK